MADSDPSFMSDVFRPYEKLVEITILGKTFLVPERNSLLRAFQFISPETIPYGRFCWNQECQYCRVNCQLSDDDRARPILSGIKHKKHEVYDYIDRPKTSGYRSIHLVYRYYSDKKQTYNNLRIEMQFRSRLQHAWATAVEVVGAFTKQALKASRGQEEWLRFFLLMSADMAMREKTSLVPDTPVSPKELKNELRDYVSRLDVFTRLQGYRAMISPPPNIVGKNPHYFLLNLDVDKHQVTLKTFKMTELSQATNEYLREEKLVGKNADVVLVSVDSVDALKRAYPNYFLDTDMFIAAVQKAIA